MIRKKKRLFEKLKFSKTSDIEKKKNKKLDVKIRYGLGWSAVLCWIFSYSLVKINLGKNRNYCLKQQHRCLFHNKV